MTDRSTRITFTFPRSVRPTTTKTSGGQVRRYQTLLLDRTNTVVAVADGINQVATPNQLKPLARQQGEALAKSVGGRVVLDQARATGNNNHPGLYARVQVVGGSTSVLYRVRIVQDGKGHLVVAMALIAAKARLTDAAHRRVQSVFDQLVKHLRVPGI